MQQPIGHRDLRRRGRDAGEHHGLPRAAREIAALGVPRGGHLFLDVCDDGPADPGAAYLDELAPDAVRTLHHRVRLHTHEACLRHVRTPHRLDGIQNR